MSSSRITDRRRGSGAPHAPLVWLLALLSAIAGGSAPVAGAGAKQVEVERLAKDLARAAAKHDWGTAVAAAHGLAAARPDSALDAYNLACMLSRAGQSAAAVATLARSAELGFAFTSTLLRDEDLDAIRGASGFAAALDQVRANNAAELERAKPLLSNAPLLTFEPRQKKATGTVARPLIVALHGYGGTPAPLAELYRAAAVRLGAILVVPRGQEAVGKGFGWGIVEQAEYLVEQAIARTAAERPVGPVVLAGFSQGAGVALTIAVRHPERYAGVVAVAGFFEERLAPLPERVAPGFPRFCFLNGERDEAAANNRHAALLLKRSGAAVRVRIYPGLGHEYPAVEERDRELDLALRFALGH
jgi:phospholipase/carboxylesterase